MFAEVRLDMKLITAKQASEMLGLRLPRLYELTRSKKVPFVRFGDRQIRFDPDVLTAWIEQEARLNASLSTRAEAQQ
jgi:excisionase family DNA binding protein